MQTRGATSETRDGLRNNMRGLMSLALASCLAVTTEMLPVGLLPVIGQSLGVTESATGLLVSLYAGMVAVLAVPMTIATRSLPRKPLLLATLFGYIVSNILVATAPSIAFVATGRVIGGVAHALFFSLCIGYVPRLVGPANIGRGLALAAGGATAGYVLGVPLSTSLGSVLGWRTSFVVLAVLSALTFALVARLLPSVPAGTESKPARRGHAQLAAVVSSNALTFLGHYTLYTYISVLLLTAGARESAIGPLLLVCGVCGLIGLWLAGRTLDRSPRRTTLTVLGVVVCALLAVGATHLWLVPVILAAAVWSGAFGGVPSLYQSAAVRTGTTSPELAGAWINATSNIGIAGGAALGGAVLPIAGVNGLAWTGAGFVAFGLVVALACRRAFPPSETTDRGLGHPGDARDCGAARVIRAAPQMKQ